MDGNKHLRAVKTAKLSVASNICLIAVKLAAGVAIGSAAVVSEAIHSLTDLIAALIAFFALKEAAKPADDVHPYGHGKFENMSGSIEALLIFAAAALIIYDAVLRFIDPKPVEIPVFGALVMFFSAAVNFFVSKKLFSAAKQTGSIALEADGWHLRTDVYASLGVAVVLCAIAVLKQFWQSAALYRIDSIAAFAVAVMIVRAAYKLTLKSARDLFDVALPDEQIAEIENIIRSEKRAAGFHDLKTRKSGSKCFAEFHILMHPQMTVLESHEITRELTKKIKEKFEDILVNIHVEPCDDTCTDKCKQGCFYKNKSARPKALN